MEASAFEEAAKAFAASLGGDWQFVEGTADRITGHYECGYLTLERAMPLDTTPAAAAASSDEEADSAKLPLPAAQSERVYIFHVIYSHSYRCPVLYLNSHHRPGTPPSPPPAQSPIGGALGGVQSLHEDFPATRCAGLVLSLQMHPLQQVPWYVLHPCQTEKTFRLLFPDAAAPEKLRAWMHFVLEPFGLEPTPSGR